MPNPFIRPKNRPKVKGTDFVPYEEDLIYEYEVKPALIQVGKGEYDFVTKDKVILARKYSRADALRQNFEEVGILNILKKIRDTGDLTLSNQRVPEFENLINEDIEDRLNKAISAKADYAALPESLTGGKSFNEFTENKMTSEQLEAYVQAEVAKRIEASKKVQVEEVSENA